MRTAEAARPSAVDVLSELLGERVTSVDRIGGGRNSRVFKVSCGASRRYLAKFYPDGGSDDRDRLAVEFTSLRFLFENGVWGIPRPIAADVINRCAVYEYIDGDRIASEHVTASDIEQAAGFLTRLKELTGAEGSSSLPAAAEACFSLQDAIDNIENRLDALLTLPRSGPQYSALHDFLKGELSPALDDAKEVCRSTVEGWGTSLSDQIEPEYRTLSPSDFGFHNALRRHDGQIVFVDFEYFGWDDPAKMVVDFLLHPGMDLDEALRQRFLTGILGGFRDYPDLGRKVELVYPLFALKWCLILLNEFLPEIMDRRALASAEPVDGDELRALQLPKARRMLQVATRDNGPFTDSVHSSAQPAR